MRCIKRVVRDIVAIRKVSSIWLFNKKSDLSGKTSSFKLCVVIAGNDKLEAEKELYLGINCDVPFDLVIYTKSEWDSAKNSVESFAYSVVTKGALLYEG